MTPTRKREIEIYLTGRTPLEFQDEKPPEAPSDVELKNWVLVTSVQEVRRIYNGPNGQSVREKLAAAFQRMADLVPKKPGNGRVQSTMQFDQKK